MEALFQYLNSLHPLSQDLAIHFSSILKHRKLKPREYLLKEGQICNTVSFIKDGLVHLYFTEGEKKVTNWFMHANDMAIAAKSFFLQIKSSEAIQAIEPTEILYITFEELYKIYDKFIEFNIVRAKLSEKYYLLKDEHALQLQRGNARDRYDWFIQTFPSLLTRVPSKYIASFLGITEETFSRIRR